MPIHSLPTELHQALVDFIDAGRAVALATVMSSVGSSPRKPGTKAIIDASGDIWGTIGGGKLEADVQRLGASAIASGRPVVFETQFAGASASGEDPVCGGGMRILIDPTVAEHRDAYIAAAGAIRERRDGVLLTSVLAGEALRVSVRFFAKDDGGQGLSAEQSRAVATARGLRAAVYFSGGSPRPSEVAEGVAEALAAPPLLLIAGGGHIGQALARQASLVGFEIVVIDDRPEMTDAALYPRGVTARCGDFTSLIDGYPATPDTCIAIVGRGHREDAKALGACIGRPAGYIGMMGSRRKVAVLREELIARGACRAEQFDRVCAPIGIDIGAETVPEIAASIVAQLVAVRRLGKPAVSQ